MIKFLTVSCLAFSSLSYATLPDLGEVWREIHKQEYNEAKCVLEDIWDECYPDPVKNSIEAEEWIHYTFIKLYIAYKEANARDFHEYLQQIHSFSFYQSIKMNPKERE